jgi:hypothetical protein
MYVGSLAHPQLILQSLLSSIGSCVHGVSQRCCLGIVNSPATMCASVRLPAGTGTTLEDHM